jgi:hypothetical protein
MDGYIIESGVVDQRWPFLSTPGLLAAGSFTVRRQRGTAASAPWSTTPDIVEDSNCPGLYRILVNEGTTITTGKSTESFTLYITHPSLGGVPIVLFLTIYDALRANAVQMNSSPIFGSGTAGDEWEGDGF